MKKITYVDENGYHHTFHADRVEVEDLEDIPEASTITRENLNSIIGFCMLHHDKLQAIKFVRMYHYCSLKTAKEYVEMVCPK